MMTNDEIAEALQNSLGPQTRNEKIPMQFMRFSRGFSSTGTAISCTYAQWYDYRAALTNAPWPRGHLDDPKKRKILLQLEMGALCHMFTDEHGNEVGGKRNHDVRALTWIFLDSDSGRGSGALRQWLDRLKVCYLIEESATSVWRPGEGKWHCFIPLLRPKFVPDCSSPAVAQVETAEKSAAWWRRIHNHVASLLFQLGGIDYDGEGDKSSDTLARAAFVPQRPDGGTQRQIAGPTHGGCLLDLDKFLEATGFDEVEPPPAILVDDIEKPLPRPGRAPVDPDDVVDGPTPNETSGSLVFKALDFFPGMIGPHIRAKDAYMVRCPWRHLHSTDVKAGTQDRYSDSTVIFMSGKGGGGIHCFHGGCVAASRGGEITTGDVLKWARENGNTTIPDSSRWTGSLALIGSEAVEATPSTPPPSTPPLAFAGAPVEDVEPEFPEPQATQLPSKRIDIEIDNDALPEMERRGVAALALHPSVFKVVDRKGQHGLVELIQLEEGAQPHIKMLDYASMAPRLQEVSRWYALGKKKAGDDEPEKVIARPDKQVMLSILHAGHYAGVRELKGVITTPTFHRDGTLNQAPGYNAAMRVLYVPSSRAPLVSPDPSHETLQEAKAKLLYVTRDFPFPKGKEDLFRGVWCSAIFTRLLRFAFSQTTANLPMIAVSSGMPGCGKGKFVDSAAIISDGVKAKVATFTADNAENERVIGAILSGKAPIVVLDNIARGLVLAGTAFEAFLTTSEFTTRKIGSSDQIKKVGGHADSLFWATGCAMQIGPDMSRRVLRVDIEDRSGKPTDRQVKESDLEAYCSANRPELLKAALTLCSGFFAARRRGYRAALPQFASFEPWSIVREVVVWMGLPDPFLARAKADDKVSTGKEFLVQHLLAFGADRQKLLVGDIVKMLIDDNTAQRPKGEKPKHAEFYSFLVDQKVLLDNVRAGCQSLGAYLARHVGEVVADEGRRWMFATKHSKTGAHYWLVEQTD